MLRGCALAAACCATARAHGIIRIPPAWQYANADVTGDACGRGACEWFSNYTFLPQGQRPTIPQDSPLRTWQDPTWGDWTATHPWRAPGRAPVFSPCGTAGGNPNGCDNRPAPAYGPAGGGTCLDGWWDPRPAADGRTLGGDGVVTYWRQGDVVEAGQSLVNNHGGGYSYRLCKRPASGNYSDMTEECFQKTSLAFVGNTSFIQYTNGSGRFEIDAVRTAEGTYPPGSMWSRNPIPARWDIFGDHGDTQFPAPTLHGEPVAAPSRLTGYTIDPVALPPNCPLPHCGPDTYAPGFNDWILVDKVQVPKDLPTGEYAVSYRWDCEQTPQVWLQCASVTIVASGAPLPAPAPGPRCGDAAHGCCLSRDASTGACTTWTGVAACTLSRENCEGGGGMGQPQASALRDGCKGTWMTGVAPDTRCDDAGSKHACGMGCAGGACYAYAAVGPCTTSQQTCESACSGKWIAS